MDEEIVPYKSLLDPPISRAAYSDRAAWLMATMSKLAYVRFEDATPVNVALADAMRLITGKSDPRDQAKARKIDNRFSPENLTAVLRDVAGAAERQNKRQDLEDGIRQLQFALEGTYSIHIPLVADTQAFLARLDVEGRKPILVLAFRGTEPKKPADLKSDLEAEPKILGALGGPGATVFVPEGQELSPLQKTWPKVKVHPGFWKAFDVIKAKVEETLSREDLKDLPLYITGHSLGGALAVVATYALASDRVAACYTFGGPRAGNLQFGQRIKPPVYRVVNASDIVARVPPGVIVDLITVILRAVPAIPYLDKLADFLERFRGYRHYGDMRYLSASASALDAESQKTTFPTLIVHANPAQMSRWYWTFRRYVSTRGRAAVADHSIDEYIQKLAYWAYVRSQ